MIPTGTVRTKRFSVPDPVSYFNVPDGVSFAVIKNVGANAMRFNFDDDDPGDYWTLEVNAQSPIMDVKSGQKFNTDGVGGATTIEVLLWG